MQIKKLRVADRTPPRSFEESDVIVQLIRTMRMNVIVESAIARDRKRLERERKNVTKPDVKT